ncbi:MAG: hypothetical protein QM727_13355 [Niabella sp.]
MIGLRKYTFNRFFYGTIALQISVVVFVFPLAKSFFDNPDYNAASAIREQVNKENIPLYELGGGFCPEIIWDYGTKIPDFDSSSFTGKRIGLLAERKDSALVQQTFVGHQIIRKGYINLNIAAKGNNSGKDRLYRDFYIISKEQE